MREVHPGDTWEPRHSFEAYVLAAQRAGDAAECRKLGYRARRLATRLANTQRELENFRDAVQDAGLEHVPGAQHALQRLAAQLGAAVAALKVARYHAPDILAYAEDLIDAGAAYGEED